MQGDSSNSVLATTTTTTTTTTAAGGGGEAAPQKPSGADEEGGGAGGQVGQNLIRKGSDITGVGNRWPKQETIALLKIRSDMDTAFREASVKGPLWDEVSRKLAELGYHRSAKKCREKFENVSKYHRRTKDGRAGKHECKTYRFFDHLEAFKHHQNPQPPPPLVPSSGPQASTVALTAAPTTMHVANAPRIDIGTSHHLISTIPSTTTQPINLTMPPPFTQITTNPTESNIRSSHFTTLSADFLSGSTSSDDNMEGCKRRGTKRKWKEFFGNLMMEVIQKQEEMHNKFLEAIHKHEQERITREESWRAQEMARISREREILAQERSMIAEKNSAVMAFLQKISSQKINPDPSQNNNSHLPPLLAQPQLSQATPPPPQLPVAPRAIVHIPTAPMPPKSHPPPPQVQNQDQMMELVKSNGDQTVRTPSTSPSRWPKVEIEALINLRKRLDTKYQENEPKGPMWEEISAGMKRLGYNRNAKRCKEKWENINKYFQKVKGSNKQRPQDSKTCPYFHLLDAFYEEKNTITSVNSEPLMVTPEQQWPPPPQLPPSPQKHDQEHHSSMHIGNVVLQENQGDHYEEDDDEDDDDEDGGGYEIAQNNKQHPPPPTHVASVATCE